MFMALVGNKADLHEKIWHVLYSIVSQFGMFLIQSSANLMLAKVSGLSLMVVSILFFFENVCLYWLQHDGIKSLY